MISIQENKLSFKMCVCVCVCGSHWKHYRDNGKPIHSCNLELESILTVDNMRTFLNINHYQQLSSNIVSQLENENCCVKHC